MNNKISVLDAVAILASAKRRDPAAIAEAIDSALVSENRREIVGALALLGASRLGKKNIKQLAKVVARMVAKELTDGELE